MDNVQKHNIVLMFHRHKFLDIINLIDFLCSLVADKDNSISENLIRLQSQIFFQCHISISFSDKNSCSRLIILYN
jgi:hypothetical protein